MRTFGILLFIFIFVGCATPTLQEKETARFNKFLDTTFETFLSYSPESQTYLGRKTNYDKLNDRSEAFHLKMHELEKASLVQLKQFKYDLLDHQAQISYKLFEKNSRESIEDFQWRNYWYTLNQQYGAHTQFATFMMNMHRVDNESELKAYISRLKASKLSFQQVREQVLRAEKQGVMPPKFVFPYVMDATKKIIQGRPFDSSKEDSPLYGDFKAKLEKLNLSKDKNKEYLAQVEGALKAYVFPAYSELLKMTQAQYKRASTKDGVWKLPKGKEFYNVRLQRHTTTNMTASEIHKLGLKQVARLHKDMRMVLKKIGYKGSLQSFFKKIREDKALYYDNTPAGKQAYIDKAKSHYKEMFAKVPRYFRLKPKAPFEIKPVEKFRENSAGIAFYERPSEDGSRPGVYYINTRNMRDLPKFELEAILYHEGAPGHHFQIALAQELKGLPMMRKYGGYTAYSEGWGLYTERLAKEMGGYKDNYSEFGRLSAELLRATRLVVDTGIHSKKWSRKKAINYLVKNLPGTKEDLKNQIERYIVMPGQATAYMVGMLKIVDLREAAKAQLGSKFDIRDFHDLVLGSGAMPLDVLEVQVNRYVSSQKASDPGAKKKL